MISHQLGASYTHTHTHAHTQTHTDRHRQTFRHSLCSILLHSLTDTSTHTLSFLPMLIGLAIVPLSHPLTPPPTYLLSHVITELLGVKHATISLRSDMTDVVAAIKTDKQLFLPYYFGTD